MSVFTYIPDRGYTKTSKPRVLLAQFGDGYAQRATAGINNIVSEWNLTFSSRTITEANNILAFLVATGGVSYMDWTPPQEAVAVKVIASDWSSQYESAISRTITVKFTQVFDL